MSQESYQDEQSLIVKIVHKTPSGYLGQTSSREDFLQLKIGDERAAFSRNGMRA